MSVLPVRYIVEAGTLPTAISAQLVNSTPACSYVDSAGNLKFAKNASADGSGAWTVTIAVPTLGVGAIKFTSLLVVGNLPAIAYSVTIGSATSLSYVRATNNNGTAWTPSFNVIAPAVNVSRGLWCSLANVDGNPSIAYLNATNNTIEYIRSTNVIGTVWPTTAQTISQPNEGGTNINLKVFNGRPSVCYFDNIRFRLLYLTSNTVTGLPIPSIHITWPPPFIIDVNSAGDNCSLGILDNDPMISYFQVTTISNSIDRLRFISARTNGFNDIDWSPDAVVNVSSQGSNGPTSVGNVGGFPAIAFRNGDNLSVNVAYTTSILGFSAWFIQILDDSVNSGISLSAIAVGPKLGVFYSDSTTPNLKYVY